MPKLPRIPGKKVVAAFERAGFVHDRTRGSHYILVKEGETSILSKPVHGNCDVGPGLLRAQIRNAGMTVDEFLELLKQV